MSNTDNEIYLFNKIADYITDVSFKPLLESDERISDMYDNDEVSHQYFQHIVRKYKSIIIDDINKSK